MEQRLIDANAYSAEMKTIQDALKELMDDADALDNWEMYDGLSRAFSVFVEAKLTLDAMPTVDAVPVEQIEAFIGWRDRNGYTLLKKAIIKALHDYRADGERRSDADRESTRD
jgi:predicted nucleotidyltransferase